MAEDHKYPSFTYLLSPTQWDEASQVDQNSHQGTWAYEWSDLSHGGVQVAPSFGMVSHQVQQQSRTPQLHSSPIPPWPSTICRQLYPNLYAHPVRRPPTDALRPSVSTPRKTLSDLDRQRMCQYAKEHPKSKQKDIGAIFGVDRSTVSKVLRNQEKYMQDEDVSPAKRRKRRCPDVERALAVWAKNQVKNGLLPTDDQIRETARLFSAPTSSFDEQIVVSPGWTVNFETKYNLVAGQSGDVDAASALQTSGEILSMSPRAISSSKTSSTREYGSVEDERLDHRPRIVGVASSQTQAMTSSNITIPDTVPSACTSTTSRTLDPPLLAKPIAPPASKQDSVHGLRPQPSMTTGGGGASSATGLAARTSLDLDDEEFCERLMCMDEAVRFGQSQQRVDVSPLANRMPLPPNSNTVHNIDTRRELLSASSKSLVRQVSLEEARQAAKVVINFLEQQRNSLPRSQETVDLRALLEKLDSGNWPDVL